MKKPRSKKYVPKDVSANAMNWAIAGRCLMPEFKQIALMEPVLESMMLLRKGAAGRDDWNSIANAMNIAEALAHHQIGPNLLPQILAAQSALHAVAMRMLNTGKSTCYAQELADITEGIDLYRIQLTLCTQAEMSKSVRRVEELHRNGSMADVKKLYEGMEK